MASPTVRGRGGLESRDAAGDVVVVDTPAERVHHPADLVGAVLAVLGIVFLLVLALYARGTTTGLTEDVQGFDSVVHQILFVPVSVLEGLITVVAPAAVLTELALRRLVRQALEAVAAAVGGILIALLATWLLTTMGTDDLRAPFSVWNSGERVVTIPAVLTGAAALLTAAGARNRRRTVAWSWNLLWLGLGVVLITGLITLPGALMTVLLGRVVGLSTRYASGVQSERAYGPALVDGVRRAGFEPVRLVRVPAVTTHDPDPAAQPPAEPHPTVTRHGGNRVYAMTTRSGERFDVVVLDGDRQVVGVLTRMWRSLRMRGIDGRAVVSLRQAAERTALLSYAASAAGVRTPQLLGLAESEDSMILIQEHPTGAVPLRDLPAEQIDDAVLDAVCEQLRVAHTAGLAHRALTSEAILVETAHESGGPRALLTGWESGDVASSYLARRMDLSQLLAVLALRVGAERAVASASRIFTDADLSSIGPLLQSIALPRATREEARQHPGVLAEIREALLALLPQAQVEPERLVRLGARTVLTIVLTVAALVIVIAQVNSEEILAAFDRAQPWWAAVAFGLGMTTVVGSALTLVAFAPIRLPMWRTTLVQLAGTFIALVVPAGVGPAALNLRMLTRRGVRNALAVASVGLVQVSQFLTTVLLLLVLWLVGGRDRPLEPPSPTVLGAAGVLALAVGAALLVPRIRQWAAAKTLPVWRQTWPRLVQMLSRPRRFAAALVGNLVMTLSYLGAFYASLAAFGHTDISLIDLALIYLIGNAAGAMVPTPGGLGTVEFALITGLTLSGGVPGGIATSAVVLFRGLTFWGRIPFGWLAMRSLQRRGEL